MNTDNTNTMSNYDNKTRRFPAAFGGQRGRGGAGAGAGSYHRHQPMNPMPKKVVKEPQTVDVNSELNFPSLGGQDAWSAKKPVTSVPFEKKSYASFASDWKSSEDEENRRKLAEQEMLKQAETERMRYCTTSRIIGATRSRLYAETHEESFNEDDEYYEEDNYVNRPADDGWNLVDHKARNNMHGYDEECEY